LKSYMLRQNHFFSFLALLIFFSVAASASPTQRDDIEEASRQKNAEVETKRWRIEKEIKSLGRHEWAGKYDRYLGLGYAYSLSVAPNLGFVASWRTCTHSLYRYGKARFEKGILKLTFEDSSDSSTFIASEYYVVRWGERRYLIPLGEMIDFCNSINSGAEHCQLCESRFFLIRGSQEHIPKGMPKLPSKYASYILKEPIHTEIASIDKRYTKTDKDTESTYEVTEVTLNVGAANGIKEGIEFYVSLPNIPVIVTIIRADKYTSSARIIQFGNDDKPLVGWEVSTRINTEHRFVIDMMKTLTRE
jgi:hypothetical protein